MPERDRERERKRKKHILKHSLHEVGGIHKYEYIQTRSQRWRRKEREGRIGGFFQYIKLYCFETTVFVLFFSEMTSFQRPTGHTNTTSSFSTTVPTQATPHHELKTTTNVDGATSYLRPATDQFRRSEFTKGI